MSDTPLHSVSVAGVAFDDAGRVLLIRRRDNHQWEAPGGVLEIGESFEEGVVREVFEETGFWVEVDRLTGVYKNLAKGVVALVYRCRVTEGSQRLSEETAEVVWLPINDAINRMVPAFAVRVQDASRQADQAPASRTHDGTTLISPYTAKRPSR